MNVIPKLNLNKHPKDCDNLSLVDARNIKISHDESCITNENSIITNALIQTTICNIYKSDFLIRGIIPINTGIVLFIQDYNKVEANVNKLDIFVYNEKTIDKDENIYLAYSGLSYHGGKFIGTFTYNVENDLIVAFSEYDCDNNELIPLRTINLGSIEKSNNNDIYDSKLDESLLSIVSEVKIPSVINIEYVKGNTYKGWYYLFIRYKINKTDYTQWYPIGYPIYVDVINRNNIVRYIFNRDAFPENGEINSLSNLIIGKTPWDGYGVGCSDYFSDTTDISNETFNININNLDTRYNIYQIGFICTSKSYTKSYKSFDIYINEKINDNYTINIKNCEEYNSQELITTYYNYYNVKNIINYKNRLYIAGYNENIIENEEISNTVNNIKINLYVNVLKSSTNENNNIRRDVTFYRENPNPYQLDQSINTTLAIIEIPFSKYFGCDDKDEIKFYDSNNNLINNITIKASDLYITTSNENYDTDKNRNNGFFAIVDKTYNNDYKRDNKYIIVINDDIINKQVIDVTKIALQLGMPYVNTNNDFTLRKLSSTLIPGEIYNFFIHFVDKYGNFTNGYKINNTFPKHINSKNEKVDGIVFIINGSQIDYGQERLEYIYCSVDKTAKINDIIIPSLLTNSYTVNDYESGANHIIRFYANYDFANKTLSGELRKDTILELDFNYIKEILFDTVREYYNQGLNYEFYRIFTFNNNVNNGKYGFDNYINSNGDSLFKVPFNNISINSNIAYYPEFSNIIIPDNYVGYFISYEKFEKTAKYTGLLTLNDFRNIDTIEIAANDYTKHNLTSLTIQRSINNTRTVRIYSGTIYNAVINNNNLTGDLEYGIIENGGDSIRGQIVDGNLTTTFKVTANYDVLYIKNGYLEIPSNPNIIKKDSLNTMGSNTMNFYSDSLDIDDSLELDFNFIRIEGKNVFDDKDIPNFNYYQRNAPLGFVTDMNKVQISDYSFESLYPMPNYALAVANSVKDNRLGVGTCLIIDNKYNLFTNNTNNKANAINLYRVSLIKDNINIYNNNNKTLIKLTDVYYKSDNEESSSYYTTNQITKGLNGQYTYSGTIIYADSGVVFNETNGIVTMQNAEYQYYPTSVTKEHSKTYENDRPFMCYLQMPLIDTIFHESKCFKNEPKAQTYVVKPANNNDSAQYRTGYMVTPANSIDLFENRQGSADQFNPKTYSNYREDIKDIDIYNKTIRRSNVIQDESRENSWRKFSLEAYKNITENKGIITNLVGIGNLVLAHTEHSLFMFDLNNELKTIDQNIQLHQPDAFDVAYKEVFTSELGYGGLQDKRSAIVDQFGYIFYNNDDNNIYRFDNNQLAIISNDIVEWLIKAKPNNIRFAHDIRNNRLLIKFDYDIFRKNEDDSTFTQKRNLVLSYNYKTQNFISTHSYYFRDAYNSKNRVYFINSFQSGNLVYDSVYNFTEAVNNYCTYGNIYGYANAVEGFNNSCKLSFIVNEGYDIVKFLEYITYKLYKVDESVRGDVPYPVKELDTPYAGQILRVYNDNVNTNDINITVDNESIDLNEHKNIFGNYKKPYWDLGNWNFSYLRDMIGNEGDQSAAVMSRLYGNYFIIEFEFLMQDRRIDFESLNYKISKL